MQSSHRVSWFILLRLVVISAFLVLSNLLLNGDTSEMLGDISLTVLTRLLLATCAFSLLSLFFLKTARSYVRTLAYAQIVWDIFFVTVLILLTGGLTSPFAFLYFLSIISASILLSRAEAYYTSSLCVILYGAILDFQYYGKLDLLGLTRHAGQQYGAEYIFYLMSRGVDRTNAERMIVQGFFEEVLNRIPVPGVRNKLETEIARKLGL